MFQQCIKGQPPKVQLPHGRGLDLLAHEALCRMRVGRCAEEGRWISQRSAAQHAAAKAKGADIVIAVDISASIGNTNITNLVDVTLQATSIMFALNVEHAKKDADVLITPSGIGDIGMLDFTQKKRCMQAGIEATQKAMPNIRKVIDAWVAAHSQPAIPVP